MEVFVDFGLFEILAGLGFAVLARAVYTRALTGLVFLAASIAFPAALVIVVQTESARWLAALALLTALVNAAVVVGALQHGGVRTPELPRLRWITYVRRCARNRAAGRDGS